MSLTSEFEISEMFKKPERRKHRPNFHGDVSFCNYKTGHCTNTMACNDCQVYRSMQKIREYNGILKGE